MNSIELKSIAATAHKYLLKVLETEKYKFPETYNISAVHIGEEMREYFKAFGQTDDLEPVPQPDEK